MLPAICLLLSMAQAGSARKAPTKPVAVKAPAAKPPAKPAAPASFPIVSLRVEGAKQLPAEGILVAAGLKVGRAATRDQFETAREKLLATGLFVQAGYRYDPAPGKQGVDAVILVSEIPQLYAFRFEDLAAEPLTAALKAADPLFVGKLSATPVALKRYAAILSEAAKAGVIGRVVSAEGPEQFTILFRPDQPEATIAQVSFTGNEVLPAALLQTTVNGSAIGAIYKEERMREILDSAIRPLYEERGRLQVQYTKITASPSTENKGVEVTVEISEGPSFEIGDVKVEAGDHSHRLERAVALSSGDLANMSAVEAARGRVRTALRKGGFVKHDVKVERKLAPAPRAGGKNLVHLTMLVTPGPKYSFQSLKIEGLDILNEPQVRKMWSLEPGADFNAEYPDFFLKTIREEGMFDDLGATRSIVALDDAAQTAAVTLVFSKADPRAPKKKADPQQP